MTDQPYFSRALLDRLNESTSDWLGDFEFEVEQTGSDGDDVFFDVVVRHKFLNTEQSFLAKVVVDREMDCEFFYMDYNEDSWEMISQGTLFVWMWFDLAIKMKRN